MLASDTLYNQTYLSRRFDVSVADPVIVNSELKDTIDIGNFEHRRKVISFPENRV